MNTERQKAVSQEILECLASSPLRMTRKRYKLLETLSSIDRPVAAAELRDRAGLPESDLVTVYRTLEAFEGIGIIQKILLEDGSYIYELTEPHDHYHHFVCRECHKTARLELCVGRDVEARARKLGFSEVTHIMEVYGVCGDCRTA